MMMFRLLTSCLLGIMFLFFCVSSVSAGDIHVSYEKINDVPQVQWDILAKKKIYFGHQSVGFNILAGLKNIFKKYPNVKLNLVEGNESDLFSKPIFAHSKIDKNGEPLSKIKNFVNILDSGVGERADIAFMKLCFTDIKSETDVSKIFNKYEDSMIHIQKKYSGLKLIHFTAPLYTFKKTWKVYVKLMLGKEPWELSDNEKRHEYNNLMRQKYGKDGALFDLALVEATSPDGTYQSYFLNGRKIPFLYPDYSSDGAHLNAVGATIVAEKLLLFLVSNMNN